MENEGKIIELLSDSLKRLDQMVGEQQETNRRLSNLESKAETHEKRMESIENQLVKLNLQTGENSRAIFKLAEKVEAIADLHNRITKLEKTVFK